MSSDSNAGQLFIENRTFEEIEIGELVVPDLESGNMLVKQLDYLADSQAAGIVVGGRVPIALTSRADSALERVASCALSVLATHANASTPADASG